MKALRGSVRRPLFRAKTSTEKGRELRARRRAAGVCVACGLLAPAAHAERCEACLADAGDRAARLRDERLAAGSCARCAAAPPAPGGKWCEGCRQRERDEYSQLREVQR